MNICMLTKYHVEYHYVDQKKPERKGTYYMLHWYDEIQIQAKLICSDRN